MSSSVFGHQNPNPTEMDRAKQAMNDLNSPQMQMIFQLLNGKGITAEQAVKNLCKQRGIDVNSLMNFISKYR